MTEASAESEQVVNTRPLSTLRENGILWALNRYVFHPRGLAFGFVFQDDQPTGWAIYGDGSETYRFEDDTDQENFLAFERMIRDYSTPTVEEYNDDQPS